MTEEKQQKFTAKVRRGLVWVHTRRGRRTRQEKGGGHRRAGSKGFTASELADVESALTWIAQNKESPSAEPAA